MRLCVCVSAFVMALCIRTMNLWIHTHTYNNSDFLVITSEFQCTLQSFTGRIHAQHLSKFQCKDEISSQ